jgi:hypothetical protein
MYTPGNFQNEKEVIGYQNSYKNIKIMYVHLAIPDWIIQLSVTTLIEIDMTTSFVLLSRL